MGGSGIMLITGETIIAVAGIITALGAIFGLIFSVYRWYLKQNRQDEEIARIQKENSLICFCLSACLDGLIQLGANHDVTKAKEKLDKHLNQSAHGQE